LSDIFVQFNQICDFSTDVRTSSLVQNFTENSCSGNSTDSCAQTGRMTDRTMHMTKLIDGFRDYANAPKNICFLSFFMLHLTNVFVFFFGGAMHIERQKQGYRHCSVLSHGNTFIQTISCPVIRPSYASISSINKNQPVS